MLNATLVIACVLMVYMFIRIIYAHAYKKGCNDTADVYKACRNYVEYMSERLEKRITNRLSHKRNFKR